METSASKAIYIGTYIFVFISAFTITIYLFNAILEFSEQAYDFETKQATNQILVNVPVEKNRLLTSTEAASYYYNYVLKDIYNNGTNNSIYLVNFKDVNNNNITIDKNIVKQKGYKYLISDVLGVDSKYILKYDKKDSNGIINITLKEATDAEIDALQ